MAGRGLAGMLRWTRRRPTVVPLLVVAAVLIAVGGGGAPGDGTWSGVPGLSVVQDVAMVVILILAALGLILLLFMRPSPSDEQPRSARSWVPSLVALALVVALSFLGLEAKISEPEPEERPELAEPIETGPPVEPGPGFQASDGAALVVVLAAALALLWWASRGDPETGDDEDGEDETNSADTIGAAVVRARGHLLDQSDPRHAVLLAYGDLESALTTLGLPRDPAQTPTEHLVRALAALGLDQPERARPLIDLADLYAKARFSHHPITTDDQRRAAADLGRARVHLAGS